MASIVVTGDTSGAITIAAPAVAGTNTLTLPASTGTLVVTGGAQTIEFADGSAAAPSITNSGDTNTGMFFPAADTIAFTEGGTESMRIDSSGNLGVGETSAGSYRLNVKTSSSSGILLNGTATGGAWMAWANNGTVIGYLGSAYHLATSGSASDYSVRSEANLVFCTNGATERMRIDSSGNLLVGTTSTSRTSGNGLKVLPGTGTDVVVVGSATTNSDVAFEAYSTGASAYRFQVGYGGTIYATSTTITGISDERLKENIIDLDDGLDAVMALKPRKFDWKSGKGKDIKGDRGFIAQEFEQVFPDMIEELRDPVPEGEQPYKAVNANLIPTLVKAIQEQQQIINDLKARIETLEGAK